MHGGIPVTAIVQTLIDLATELAPNRIERAVDEADKRDPIDPESLRLALAGHEGEAGLRSLRAPYLPVGGAGQVGPARILDILSG